MHPGQGPGLSLHDLGETGGTPTVTLLESEIPGHAHMAQAVSPPTANQDDASSDVQLASVVGANIFAPAANAEAMSPLAIAPIGGDQPHNNMQPFMTMNFCIALQGVFPARP